MRLNKENFAGGALTPLLTKGVKVPFGNPDVGIPLQAARYRRNDCNPPFSAGGSTAPGCSAG